MRTSTKSNIYEVRSSDCGGETSVRQLEAIRCWSRPSARRGLERIDPAGAAFDPNEADAVAHGDGDGGPVVAEVLRPGYRWKGRVLRPAMVKVKG